MISFNADEIFEIAEQIERNGAKFYRKAAAGAARKSAPVLLKLAEMEDEHKKTFHEMRRRLGTKEQQPTTFDPEGQAAAYLRAMAEGKVFDVKADPSAKLTGKESVRDILETAIGLEKDSIVFYVGMKDLVPAGLGRDRIDEIIRQEMGHITTLSGELSAC